MYSDCTSQVGSSMKTMEDNAFIFSIDLSKATKTKLVSDQPELLATIRWLKLKGSRVCLTNICQYILEERM